MDGANFLQLIHFSLRELPNLTRDSRRKDSFILCLVQPQASLKMLCLFQFCFFN